MNLCLTSDLADLLGESLQSGTNPHQIVRLEPDGSLSGPVDDCEVLCFSPHIGRHPKALGAIPSFLGVASLKWVQSPGAGYENPFFGKLLERGVRLTNASGLHSEPLAQYVLTYVLHWEREVGAHLGYQRQSEWHPVPIGDLTAKTIGIVGLGGIGLATARVARAFGMRVVGSSRSLREAENVDAIFAPPALGELLEQSDYVVLSLPLSPTTQGMIGAEQLAQMKSSAVLINVARGGVVDEPALIDALVKKRIRGASLDVVSQEPLPAESPLWTLENVTLTPHNGGLSPLAPQRLGTLFLENLARWERGDSLINEIVSSDLTQ